MKILYVDATLKSFAWAIRGDDNKIAIRGEFENIEQVRALQLAHQIEWVKMDAHYRRATATACCILFGWETVTHPLACREIEEAVGHDAPSI